MHLEFIRSHGTREVGDIVDILHEGVAAEYLRQGIAVEYVAPIAAPKYSQPIVPIGPYANKLKGK